MDRKKFKKELESMDNTYCSSTTTKEKEIIRRSIESSPIVNGIKGGYNLIIASQELSELNCEITDALRDKLDTYGLLEEMADVYIVLEYLKQIFDVSEMDIYKARQIKINRLEKKLNENDYMK